MSMPIDWDDQRTFLAVLEEGSLSGAARRLGVAQPTVRARIKALEASLGAVLFTRSVNGLTATEQARALADPARAMARASEAFVRAASASPGQIAGVVRVSVSEFVGVEVLPEMLASLRAAHPGIVVEVSLNNSSVDLLEQEADIAVRMHPPRQDALVARKTGAIRLGFFAHRDYLARRGVTENLTLDDFLGLDFIGPDRARADLEAVMGLHPRFSAVRFAVRTDSHPAQMALCQAGLGVAVAQRAVALADPNLAPLMVDFDLPVLETWIVTHEDLRDAPRVRAVFDHLVETFTAFARLG